MAQTILTSVAEVQPASAALLRSRILALREREMQTPNDGDQAFDHLRSAVPMLHFLSMTVAEDDQYDPLFVLEANFDGEPGPFWAALEAALGSELREMLRLCKAPRDRRAALFEAITADGSRQPLAPLLEALTVWPSARHQGNRGLERARILREGKLFAAIRRELEQPALAGLRSAAAIHEGLRARLVGHFDWLDEPAPARTPIPERLGDGLRLLGFGLSLLAGVGLSGAVVWLLTCAALPDLAARLRPSSVLSSSLALLLLGLLVTLLPAAAWLRRLEQTDAVCDEPRLDPVALRAMARSEDFIAQNHMISIVHVKPGVLRMLLARIAHRALGLVVRVTARDGYLGSMRTIHFAHWAFLDNGGRLMFHSNFDGSWESYLDDFIEKAHVGLTLAWTHGVGFPATRWLFRGGATEGRKFKAWARHSMSESQLWFSAYKQYSVNQIERHARLAEGLRKPQLSEMEARTWALDL